MRCKTDDDIHRVDQKWLGFKKAPFLWTWTYSQWAFAVVSLLVLGSIMTAVTGHSLFSIPGLAVLAATGALTEVVGRWSRKGISVTSLVAAVSSEISQPRVSRKVHTVTTKFAVKSVGAKPLGKKTTKGRRKK